jgi:hypothetical protein
MSVPKIPSAASSVVVTRTPRPPLLVELDLDPHVAASFVLDDSTNSLSLRRTCDGSVGHSLANPKYDRFQGTDRDHGADPPKRPRTRPKTRVANQ